ncbi:hypothetical protein [Paenibacillus crassostreae]|uniref:Uncharacterized protein n=1 Tax=Paenibacillus crassostreae TaxID=1763538 RepID=A0A167EGJ6_9BACL|nr:hypothetical protein [Paenibacillus crassostreae]AOZ92600.1 hypothetical protein LPB68_10455 [Paenibacillus crassostreae]OAB75531.1 hypothetical protein PNBC_08540 [Paenibacillus crassostreae]
MKKIIIIGTFVIAITVSGAFGSSLVSANPVLKPLNIVAPAQDDLLHILKLSSDEELYTALYHGDTLADLAKKNGVDIQKVINLQVSELTAQLDLRYAKESITLEQYKEQKSELIEMVTKSVNGIL